MLQAQTQDEETDEAIAPIVNAASFGADRDPVSIAFSLTYADVAAAAQARAEELASLSSTNSTDIAHRFKT